MRKTEKIEDKEWAMKVSFETCSSEIKVHGFAWAVNETPIKKCLEIMARIGIGREKNGSNFPVNK